MMGGAWREGSWEEAGRRAGGRQGGREGGRETGSRAGRQARREGGRDLRAEVELEHSRFRNILPETHNRFFVLIIARARVFLLLFFFVLRDVILSQPPDLNQLLRPRHAGRHQRPKVSTPTSLLRATGLSHLPGRLLLTCLRLPPPACVSIFHTLSKTYTHTHAPTYTYLWLPGPAALPLLAVLDRS